VPAVPTIIKRSAQASGDRVGGRHDDTVSDARKTKKIMGLKKARKEGDEVRR
jgi:inhibitor of KinA sporulation pathway (predicted exonuclease)